MPYEKSTSSSPEAQSASPIQDNLKALAALFPSVVRDGQVDVDALRQLCGEAVVKENELFGLNWRGKAEARRAALTPSLGTLRPCKEESKDWDTTQNLYIEGDNLEVLKLLRKSYGGRVKMIYIDPPYNTGKEFVYPDDYQNSIENYKKLTGQEGKYATNVESSGRFHTDWLNMMYPRLVLARDLMCDDGVIFVSIDDNESGNLKKICDEIFGEINFVGQITVVANPRGRDYGGIARMHDYVFVYIKNYNNITLIRDEDGGFELFDDLGGFELRELRNRNVKFNKENRPNLYYPFYINTEEIDKHGLHDISIEPIEGWYELWPLESQGINTVWRWGKTKAEENLNINIKAKPMRNGSFMIVEKYREAKKMARSVWWDKDSNTEKGTLLVKELMDGKIFDYPKPVEMIMRTCEMAASDDASLILDFFSGSATTAHAVMKLNAEIGGNRRFILVQLPEPTEEGGEAYKAGYKNICEIGKERIRRAGDKVKEEAGLAGQNLDIGFRVYKLDSSNVKAWNPQAEDLATAVNNYAEHLVGGRTEDDFLTEIMLKSGIDLVEEVEEREIAGHRVQSLGYGQYYACMAADLANDAEEVALGIAAWHEKDCAFAGGERQDTCTVFVADRAFESNDAAKMNFVAILEQHGICNIKAL